MKKTRNARIAQRCIQAASLALFFFLLLITVWPLAVPWLPRDLYLRCDPLVAALVPVAARGWTDRLAPGLAVLLLTVVFGRVFCGYVCPLGITLDLARRASGFFRGPAGRRPVLSSRWRKVKYGVLAVMAATAVFGVNAFFWGSPIALATRFYALLAYPALVLAGSAALGLGRSLFLALDMPGLAYADLAARRFDSLYFVLAFFAALFALERVRPRFWCRYLCPAGALLALASWRPVWRRRVRACVGCGRCVSQCPTGAIEPGGVAARHAECIACRSCVDACPVHGVVFSRKPVAAPPPGNADQPGDAGGGRGSPLPSRRAFLGAAGAGAALAAVQYSGRGSFLAPGNLGNPWSPDLLRPPGSLPEPAFLDRCIRCGQCMKVCPTNGLQPVWLKSGVEGMFSPALVPRRGPCEPDCNACGRVCPTQAVTALPLAEKQWAKIGTAVVLQYRCLAWAEGRSCMVCQEVCPFGAVKIVRKEGHGVPVPVVDPARCFGCGYCEHHCPTFAPSIRVEPLSALRLADGKYRETARSMGFVLEPGAQTLAPEENPAGELPDGGPPPGFSS